jgi:acyl transferase domain-containing protein
MTEPQIWMFSGQGSQYYQMGLDLYQSDTVFRETMDRCSDHVSPQIETSLTHLIFQPRANRFEPFERTLYTHCALFSIQYSLAETLRRRGLRPDILVGYSLGEWVAHVVAGVIPAETVLDGLVAQARRVEAESPPGGMLAVLDAPQILVAHPEWFEDTWVAARNFDRHFVVTGLQASISQVEAHLRRENITIQRLPVTRAFHSPLMDVFEPPIKETLRGIAFKKPSARLFSCRGYEVTAIDSTLALWKALREPIAFPETVQLMEAETAPTYIDCGPAGTLAAFVKYNLPREAWNRCVPLITPFGKNAEKIDALALACAGRNRSS